MCDKQIVLVGGAGGHTAELAKLLRHAGHRVEDSVVAFQRFGKAAAMADAAMLHMAAIHSAFAVDTELLGKRGEVMIIDDPWRPEAMDFKAIEITMRKESHVTLDVPAHNHPHGWYRKFEKKNGKRNK